MASKNFLLVSLEETKAKELAQIVSNDVCRRILDYLAATKEATETDIAKELGIPLSTAHYNLKQLMQSGIVKAEEFHYSEKGREVLHYSLANRYIIIAPKGAATESLASKLRRVLPVVAVAAVAGAAIQLFGTFRKAATGVMETTYYSVQKGVDTSLQKAAEVAVPAAQEAARQMVTTGGEKVTSAASSAAMPMLVNESAKAALAGNATNGTTAVVIEKVVTKIIPSEQNVALWFLAGALFAIAAYIILDTISRKKQR